MKYHFHRDTILATVFILVVLWLLSVTIRTTILEPGNAELYDFDNTDVVYARSGPAATRFDSSIVIIDVGDTDRAGIAAVLEQVKKMSPAAIGIDLIFHGHRQGDSQLASAIYGTPNLVMCTKKSMEGNLSSEDRFRDVTPHTAYANFYGEEGNVVRYCLPFRDNDTSFAASLLHIADKDAFQKLCGINREMQVINYSRRDTEYIVITYKQLLRGNVDENALKNKIVLIGVCGRNPYNIEDKMLTPKNSVFMGRSLPDMHGVAIHANIIDMMLARKYIYMLPGWLNTLLALLVGWLCTGIFVNYMINKHVWAHLLIKIWQLVVLFALLLSNVLLFRYCRIKTDLTLAIIVLIFSAEVLHLYQMLALWSAQKFNHKTIFKKH